MDIQMYLEVYVPMMLIGIATGVLVFKIKDSYLISSLAAAIIMLVMLDLSQFRSMFARADAPYLLFGLALVAISIVIINIVTPFLKDKTVVNTATEPVTAKKKCCKTIRAKNKFNSRSIKRGM